MTAENADYHVYDYQVDLDSDSAPARVIRLIEPNSRVLEIGAGPGSITRHLSGGRGCDVVALEVDEAAIRKLRAHARKIIPADLNKPTWTDLLANEGKFDYVIAADVLEHVYDPLAVLKGMKSLLKPSGSIVLSLPHVSHLGVVACLMDEDFDYREWGLLDKTHIRFFGLKNIEKLYAEAGLAIAEAQYVVRTPDETEFADRWSRLPSDLRASLSRHPYGHIYQVVSRAMAADQVAKPVSLMTSSVEPRNVHPARAWFRQRVGHDQRVKLRSIAHRMGVKI